MEQNEGTKSDNPYIANKNSPLKNVGEFLREARQGRNLSIEELSSTLRIGKEQLIALEEGNENSLPEKVFIRAMIRRIAEKLNLDTSFIFEELNENKKSKPKYNPIINKKIRKEDQVLKSLFIITLSGTLGLITSIMVLKYIERNQNDTTNIQKSEILSFDKNKYY